VSVDGVFRTAWDNNFWLQVDYLQLAKAALNVSSYFTCLLYVEVWAEIMRSVAALSADALVQLFWHCSGTGGSYRRFKGKIN